MRDIDEIESAYHYQKPNALTIKKTLNIRTKARELAQTIERLLPEGRRRLVALDLVDTACTLATAEIEARQPLPTHRTPEVRGDERERTI